MLGVQLTGGPVDVTLVFELEADRQLVVHPDQSAVERTAARYRTAGGATPRVGVVVSHRPATVVHLLGILRAGAAYCPIDATVPPARKLAMAEVLDLERMVTADDHRGDVDVHGEVEFVPEDLGHVDDPAYVLCTSGSTGARNFAFSIPMK